MFRNIFNLLLSPFMPVIISGELKVGREGEREGIREVSKGCKGGQVSRSREGREKRRISERREV